MPFNWLSIWGPELCPGQENASGWLIEYGPSLRRRLRRSRARLQKLLLDEQTQNRPSPTLTAMATALELSSKLHTPVRLDRRNLHSYRLKVKGLRSVLQMSDSADSQPFVKKLGEVKDAIGEWHRYWKEDGCDRRRGPRSRRTL